MEVQCYNKIWIKRFNNPEYGHYLWEIKRTWITREKNQRERGRRKKRHIIALKTVAKATIKSATKKVESTNDPDDENF